MRKRLSKESQFAIFLREDESQLTPITIMTLPLHTGRKDEPHSYNKDQLGEHLES